MKKQKRTRVNLRIPSDLLKWAKTHAKSRNTSLTQLLVDHLTRLKTEEPLNA